MQTKSRKFLSVLLALLMMAGVIAVAPVMAHAAEAPTITTTSLPNATVDVPYSVTITATGDDPINWSFTIHDDGFLNDYFWITSSGVFNGIPPVAGTFDITFKAVNDAGYDEKTLTLVVNPAPTYNVAVSGGTGGGSYTAGATVTITAAVPGGKVFKEWTATGVTLTAAQKGSASTSFTMPAGAVTLTASFEDAKGIFGTNAKWDGQGSHWWHYLLFFLCFGFIWMWF